MTDAFFSAHAGDSTLRKHALVEIDFTLPGVTVTAAVASGSQVVTPPALDARIRIGTKLAVHDSDPPAFGATVTAALAGAGAGSVDNGAHSYKVVANRGTGRTLPSPASSPVTVVDKTTNGKVTVSRVGALATGDTWDVYRTAAGADPAIPANFKLVNASPIAAATTTYSDDIADAALGAAPPAQSSVDLEAEVVTVTAKTATTFTATFATAHPANWIYEATTPLFLTDCDVGIEQDGHTWAPGAIVPGSVSVTQVPEGQNGSFQLVDDATGSILALVKQANGGDGVVVNIWEVGFLAANQSAAPDGIEQIFTGAIDAVSDADRVLTFTLMPPTAAMRAQIPTRLLSSLVREPA